MTDIKLLEKIANEESTYVIKFTFKDEHQDLYTPVSLYWWLSDLDGEIINSRSRVQVSAITNPWYLVLSGSDLVMHDIQNDSDYRIVTVKGTYNSTYGNNLPFTYSVMFKLRNLIIIALPLDIDVTDAIFVGEIEGCSVQA